MTKLYNLRGSAYLSLTAIIWGVAFVFQSMGNEHMEPLTFTSSRYILGGLVLLPIVIIKYFNPRFLADDEILGAEGVMMMLFELDEHYPISIEDCEDEDGNRRKGIVFGSILMTDLLSEWQRRKKDLADGKISKAEYTEWKLNWPKTTDDCGKHEPAKEWRNL